MSEIKEPTARTWGLPDEPEIGTRVRDKNGTVWAQAHKGYWFDGDENLLDWTGLVVSNYPEDLVEVAAPELPTEDGALIIASGTGFEALFESRTLMRVGDYWCGLIPGAVRPTTIVQDQITSWTEAVAVPKDALDGLRQMSNVHTRKDASLHIGRFLDAVDGRQA